MDIVERSHAKALGLTRYFTGKPCPHGHITERMVSTCACVGCCKVRKAAQQKTPEYKQRHREYQRKRYHDNPKRRQQIKEYASRDDVRERRKERKYHLQDDRREYMREYRARRVKEDKDFKLIIALRRRTGMALSGKKPRKTCELLGATVAEARRHLESMFEQGMSWDNHGEWHIDHIKPLASFDLTDEQQMLEACHYTNLQPLWAEDNLKKGANYETRSDS